MLLRKEWDWIEKYHIKVIHDLIMITLKQNPRRELSPTFWKHIINYFEVMVLIFHTREKQTTAMLV